MDVDGGQACHPTKRFSRLKPAVEEQKREFLVHTIRYTTVDIVTINSETLNPYNGWITIWELQGLQQPLT
jgi:hypothetical protein